MSIVTTSTDTLRYATKSNWWLSGIAVAGWCIWHIWQAISAVTIERI
jgi:hypothetical protein